MHNVKYQKTKSKCGIARCFIASLIGLLMIGVLMSNSNAADLPPPPVTASLPAVAHGTTSVQARERFPENLPDEINLVIGRHDGKAYAIMRNSPQSNPYALQVGGRALSNVIREIAQREGITLRKNDLNDINHFLQARAEMAGVVRDIWIRVAQTPDGIEVDLGDEQHTRVQIIPGNVNIVTSGSEVVFFRPAVSLPMTMPADTGDLRLLYRYLNMSAPEAKLLIAWLSYTLAHPKVDSSNYPILVIKSREGSGKTFISKYIIHKTIDPSIISTQIMPNNVKDLAISASNGHIVIYDNARTINKTMSDSLCIASTGGALSSRQLYTDGDMHVLKIHVAIVITTLHSCIEEPDLSQRCIPIELKPIDESERKSETELSAALEEDLPKIQRGLFNLIADVFKALPDAEVTNGERMLDYVRWLAAMERVDGVPAGSYQSLYSHVLRQGQLESLQEDPLAAAVLELAEGLADGDDWYGTPAELLGQLNKLAGKASQRSRSWPVNAISLSKKLHVLQAALAKQGVSLKFARGKERTITIKNKD